MGFPLYFMDPTSLVGTNTKRWVFNPPIREAYTALEPVQLAGGTNDIPSSGAY